MVGMAVELEHDRIDDFMTWLRREIIRSVAGGRSRRRVAEDPLVDVPERQVLLGRRLPLLLLVVLLLSLLVVPH